MTASYLALHASGELSRRAEAALARLAACDLCPRECGIDRTAGELGFCRTGRLAQATSADLHFGEEAPLVGERGSGTIFFAQCNLDCVFCQNWDISQGGPWPETTARDLALAMIALQEKGAANVNFVTPSHVAAQILEALPLAVDMGLRLPLIWNCGGYESLSTLRLLDGVVDIYMPDAKFTDPEAARAYCRAPDYPERAREAIREMHRQVGDLVLDASGLAVRGLLVRHLVMPGRLGDSLAWLRFLAEEVSPRTYVNVMPQYRPCGQAGHYPELASRPSSGEIEAARTEAVRLGLRLDERRGLSPRLLRRLWGE